MKITAKTYQGVTYIFTPELGRGFKVQPLGFASFWYQNRISVKDAKRKFETT